LTPCVSSVFLSFSLESSVTDAAQALQHCNATPFGLQAGIFTHNIQHVFRAYRTLRFGGVVINDVPSIRTEAMPVRDRNETEL
jgi:glyceraldehyde-3-phosphate dehydrogenase (NADP+)